MAVKIVGKVKYNRVMEGTYEEGKRKGEKWEFLSLEIIDPDTAFVWSAQLPSEDPSYKDYGPNSLKNHKVKAYITAQSASERTLPNGQTVMQIRSQLADLEDLGVMKREDD